MSDSVQWSLMSSSSVDTARRDHSIEKHGSSKLLVNRYLSTAVQYLNRSKSFHIPLSNNVRSPSIIPWDDPSNRQNGSTTMNINPIDLQMKSHGFVTTLRRSLRKSKDRSSDQPNEMKMSHTITPILRKRPTDFSSSIFTAAMPSNELGSNVCADEIHLSGK